MPRHLLIGGLFTRIDGSLCTPNLEVLDAITGARVSVLAGDGFNGPVTALAIDEAAQKIYVAGCFTEYNGVAVPAGLIRLDFDLTRDLDFSPPGFHVDVASAYPVPTQLFVSGSHVYAVASNTYTTFQKNIKHRRVFGFPTNHFATSLQDGAYWGPPIVRFAKSTGALDTAWVTDEWVWDESDPDDRWVLQAACAHTSGAIIVSVAQVSGGSAGALLLLDPADCSLLHAIDSAIAFIGLQPGVAVDVTTLPNGSVIIVHQDAASGAHFTFRDTSANVFDPIEKQGAMFHVLQVVANKFVVDTGFTAVSKWEFQVGGQDKYGLADIPFRLGKELIATSPIITTLPYLGGDAAYFGKWGTNAPGAQLGLVFWHGDPYTPSRCWDISNGSYNPAQWETHGFYSETGPLGETWVDTVAAYPLAVLGSALESLDDGDLEPGVGVFVSGPVKAFKNTDLKGLCQTQTLSIDGGAIAQASFQYYPLFKVTALGDLDATFVHHLFEYQEADADQLAGLETGIPDRLYCGRVLCAAVLPGPNSGETATLIPHPPNWIHPVDYQCRWENSIAEALTAAEERAAWRQRPLRQLRYTVSPVDLAERILLEERLLAALKSGLATVPYWGRSSTLASDATSASLLVTIETSAWPWQTGDWIFFMDDQRRWDLVQLANVSGATLTLASALSRTYPKGSAVWPTLSGRLSVGDQTVLTNHQGEIELGLVETDPATVRLETSCPLVTTYLGRPLLPFPINWADGITKRFEFDLRELLVGFGKSVFAPNQSHVTQGFETSLWLRSDAEIKAFDCFTQALHGRLKGFWLRSPLAGAEILEMGAFDDRFYIRDIGLRNTWQLHPDQYLAFTYPDDTPRLAKIHSVQDAGGGRELVTLDAEVDIAVGWEVSRLHYVRLADDVERARFIAENWQSRRLRVVELPHEYAAAETGQQPVFLYRFWMDVPSGTQSWRFTSYAENVTSSGQLYTAKPITHGEIRRSTRSDREEVRIEAIRESDHPLALLWPFRLSLPLWVEIKEATLSAPDVTTTVFLGQVDRAPVAGRKISASCASLLDALGAQAMRFLIGPKCNHKVYSLACGVAQGSFEVAVTIASLSADGLTVRITGAGLSGKPAHWFADGWIQTGSGLGFQYATVLSSAVVDASTQDLVLNWPLHAALTGDTAKVVAGCDGKFATCGAKFSNQVNFGGHPRVPVDNPSLPHVPLDTGTGKK